MEGGNSFDSWSRNSIDVAVLKAALSKLQLFGGEREFNLLLEVQVANCDRFYNAVIADVLEKTSVEQARVTDSQAIKLTNDIVRLDEFGNNNVMRLVSLLKAHDEKSKCPLIPFYQWKIQRTDFCSPEALDPLLLRLSSMHVTLRQLKDLESKDRAPVPSFGERSTKCWIQTNNVIKIMCDVLKHLPIEEAQPSRLWERANAVYYDDDQLSMYSTNLGQEAILVRFRWVGELSKDTEVKLERFVGNECDSLMLRHDNVLGFVTGKFQPIAEQGAHPSSVEIQQMIINDGLKPCLQTQYNRAVLKKPDESVRVNLDTSVLMLRESQTDRWRRRDSCPESDVHRFPFALIEIKLRGGVSAPWVDQIKQSGLVIPVENFSKYAHGVAVLYPGVKPMPYWLDETFIKGRDTGIDPDLEIKGGTLSNAPKGGESLFHIATGTLKSGISTPPPPAKVESPPTRTLCWNVCKRACCCCSNSDTKTSRLKVEPKTLLANERTYLQWFMLAVVMGVFSLGYVVSNSPLSVAMGRIFLPLAAAIGLYSLVLFHWRTEMLLRRLPSQTYADRVGPTLITIVFVFILLYGLVITASPTSPLFTLAFVPLQPFSSRVAQEMQRCTLPLQLSVPPEAAFTPTGMAFLGDVLYVCDRNGRVGQLKGSDFTVFRSLAVPPGGPTHLTGLAVLPSPNAEVIYVLRQTPLAILELNATSGRPLRTFDLGTQSEAVGFTIVPSGTDGSVKIYTSATDGSLSVWSPFFGPAPPVPTRLEPSQAGFDGPDLDAVSLEAPMLMYLQNRLYAHFRNRTKVYALDQQGMPSLVKEYSFALPGLGAFAVSAARQQAVVGTQDERVVSMSFHPEDGFAFC